MATTLNLLEVKTAIEEISEGYGDSFKIWSIWSTIMQIADEKKHFASDIVERAVLRGKRISEKQAWVVAYFAKNNGLLTA